MNMVVDSLLATLHYDLQPPYIALMDFELHAVNIPLTSNDKWGMKFQLTGQEIEYHMANIEMHTAILSKTRTFYNLVLSGQSVFYVYFAKDY